ncbi:unnamed protein product [Cuscuta campestris]|uniref:Uncharacterized protein n=1 Tax=Cuscuta campestris TaxID=132261 RepID=A0A484M602_9ASTE|nr:unnamed protein product [Cuscuta campestris]
MALYKEEKQEQLYQNVVVIRHGPRLDNFDESWVQNAGRPWDPPLYDGDEYKELYSETAKKIREGIGAPIHRVFVSPFRRCLQTASRTMEALSSDGAGGVAAGLPQIKAGVELGLAEIMNRKVIWHPPQDGDFKFVISECESQLPTGTTVCNADRVYEQIPEWEESEEGARERFMHVFRTLADKYPRDNLLIVTHGGGVEAAVLSSAIFPKGSRVRIEYCAYVHFKRPIVTLPLQTESHSGIALKPPKKKDA